MLVFLSCVMRFRWLSHSRPSVQFSRLLTTPPTYPTFHQPYNPFDSSTPTITSYFCSFSPVKCTWRVTSQSRSPRLSFPIKTQAPNSATLLTSFFTLDRQTPHCNARIRPRPLAHYRFQSRQRLLRRRVQRESNGVGRPDSACTARRRRVYHHRRRGFGRQQHLCLRHFYDDE